MTTLTHKTANNKNLSEINEDSCIEVQKYQELFGNQTIFTVTKPRSKAGFKNWNDPQNYKSASELGFLIDRERNIGISLGSETDRGYTVCFDKESYGTIPDYIIKRIEEYAVCSWSSQSGGYNHLLTVTEEAYEYLNQFKTKVTFQGDKHDLELLTTGHAIVPPSKIDENHQYNDLQTYPQAPTVDLDSVVQILNDIPVSEKEKESGGNDHSTAEVENPDTEIRKLPSDFDIESHFRENVAYFSGNFDNNKSHFKQFLHEVLQQKRIRQKVFTCPEDRSKNEKLLAIDLAWYTQNDTKTIQYIFEQILPEYRDGKLKFNQNNYHKKDCLDLDKYVSRPYWIQGLSFNFREQLATIFFENEQMNTKELKEGRIFNTRYDIESYSPRQIDNGLKLFKELGLIEQITEGTYKNKSIDEKYIQELNEVCENSEYKPIKYPNEDN